jgi:hypothetical protein
MKFKRRHSSAKWAGISLSVLVLLCLSIFVIV